MIFVGVDPGKAGAIATIRITLNGTEEIEIIDMPLLPGGGIDAERIQAHFKTFIKKAKKNNESIFCSLEKAQPMPTQGVVSVFNYGKGYGKLLAILEIMKVPFEETPPSVWKKAFSVPTKKKTERKDATAKIAIQLFPNLKNEFYTERGRLLDGRVEALLIAKYSSRLHYSKEEE